MISISTNNFELMKKLTWSQRLWKP